MSLPWRGPVFSHVVSIGSFCSVARELDRYGLRDASYPLDWVICSASSAVRLLESRFAGFPRLESLERDSVHAYIVRDTQAGVSFYHDFDTGQPLETQYDSVRSKYERRAERLSRAIRRPTLFVRWIDGQADYDYLNENLKYVLRVLKTYNSANDLLLVGLVGLPERCGQLRVYTVEADPNDTVAREFVRKNPELRRRLLMLRYPLSKRLANLWYRDQRKRAAIRASSQQVTTSSVYTGDASLPPEGTE